MRKNLKEMIESLNLDDGNTLIKLSTKYGYKALLRAIIKCYSGVYNIVVLDSANSDWTHYFVDRVLKLDILENVLRELHTKTTMKTIVLVASIPEDVSQSYLGILQCYFALQNTHFIVPFKWGYGESSNYNNIFTLDRVNGIPTLTSFFTENSINLTYCISSYSASED